MKQFNYNDKVRIDNMSTLTGTIIGWGMYMRAKDKELHRAALVQLDKGSYLKNYNCYISVMIVHEDNLTPA